jgi:hypothetical protein
MTVFKAEHSCLEEGRSTRQTPRQGSDSTQAHKNYLVDHVFIPRFETIKLLEKVGLQKKEQSLLIQSAFALIQPERRRQGFLVASDPVLSEAAPVVPLRTRKWK